MYIRIIFGTRSMGEIHVVEQEIIKGCSHFVGKMHTGF